MGRMKREPILTFGNNINETECYKCQLSNKMTNVVEHHRVETKQDLPMLKQLTILLCFRSNPQKTHL